MSKNEANHRSAKSIPNVTPCRSNLRLDARRNWRAGVVVSALALMLGALGCGSDVQQAFLQAGAAAGRTALDDFLSDVLNAIADNADNTGDTTGTGGGDTGTDGGGDTGGGNGSGGDGGGSATGAMLFADNGCGGCHCDTGLGGCALSAPPIVAIGEATLDENLRGADAHPIKVDLSDQELTLLAEFLVALRG